MSFLEAGFVGGHHILDVDEGVVTSVQLKGFQSLLNEVSDVLSLLLAVVYTVTNVHCMGGWREGGKGREGERGGGGREGERGGGGKGKRGGDGKRANATYWLIGQSRAIIRVESTFL